MASGELRAWNPGWIDWAQDKFAGLYGDYRTGMRDARKFTDLFNYAPVAGEAIDLAGFNDALREGRMMDAGIYGAAAAIPGIPGRPLVEAIKDYVPQKTVKAYKMFRRKGDEIFPLFVNANDPVEINKWLQATAGELTDKGQVKSKLGPLAYRPGWHAGDLPVATHIGGKSQGVTQKKPDYRPDEHVWAEIEMPDDFDWQSEALRRATKSKAGVIIPRTAHITDQVPYQGHYRYKTNPNMTGNWLISGDMKVNRLLADDEVKAINDAAGVADLPRLHELLKR